MSERTGGDIAVLTVAALVILPLQLVLSGLLLSSLWSWFVVPSFGLPSVSTAMAAGIGILISAIRGRCPDTDDQEIGEIVGGLIGRGVAAPLMMLGVAYLVHLWAS